jgi:hypothetical protein
MQAVKPTSHIYKGEKKPFWYCVPRNLHQRNINGYQEGCRIGLKLAPDESGINAEKGAPGTGYKLQRHICTYVHIRIHPQKKKARKLPCTHARTHACAHTHTHTHTKTRAQTPSTNKYTQYTKHMPPSPPPTCYPHS